MSCMLDSGRQQCVLYAAMVLQGTFTEALSPWCPLLPFLLNHNLPRGFLEDLVSLTADKPGVFSTIFSPLLQNLCQVGPSNNIT